jgi:hypothetical protein
MRKYRVRETVLGDGSKSYTVETRDSSGFFGIFDSWSVDYSTGFRCSHFKTLNEALLQIAKNQKRDRDNAVVSTRYIAEGLSVESVDFILKAEDNKESNKRGT